MLALVEVDIQRQLRLRAACDAAVVHRLLAEAEVGSLRLLHHIHVVGATHAWVEAPLEALHLVHHVAAVGALEVVTVWHTSHGVHATVVTVPLVGEVLVVVVHHHGVGSTLVEVLVHGVAIWVELILTILLIVGIEILVKLRSALALIELLILYELTVRSLSLIVLSALWIIPITKR